jgi:hypothetical protein
MEYDFFSFEKKPIYEYETLLNKSVFIGCDIKTKYDEDRIVIKDDFNPKRIKHLDKNLYGVFLEPTKEHLKLLNFLEIYKNIDLFFYNKTLNEFDLTCEDNFLYLNYGLYPIDSKHILKYYPKFCYDNFFINVEHLPNYQRIKSINMMLLFPEQYK